jgi:hypothetical protein
VKRLLLDNMMPRKLAVYLKSRYMVAESRALGWAEIKNGALLREAETTGFDVLLTADKNLRSQQNLSNRTIALVVLGSQHWDRIEAHIERVVSAIDSADSGTVVCVDIPYARR